MSLKIIKAGILDTVQDGGRYGYQHAGINPGGAMDRFSAQLANSLLGKDLAAPVLELHFPASAFLFIKEAVFCITGADFSPEINGKSIPLNQPVVASKNSVLEFTHWKKGARCYLSLFPGIRLNKWLDSYGTNIKAVAGGWRGRALLAGDTLPFDTFFDGLPFLGSRDFVALPWKAMPPEKSPNDKIRFIRGNEWNWLTREAIHSLVQTPFRISGQADRMGYRLTGPELKVKEQRQLISSAVGFGTIQLLPDGQLIILMADHQTTGGYPRIGHVITTDLNRLAQLQPGSDIGFCTFDLGHAEELIVRQQTYLRYLQMAVSEKFRV